MLQVAGLHLHAERTAVDLRMARIALMLHRQDIGSMLTDNAAHLRELSRLVGEVDGYRSIAAALHQSASDDTIERSDVDISAGHQAHHLLALDRHLVEHRRSHRHSTGSLSHEFLLLYKL